MKYDTIIFDLDGTLTESGIGIINSSAYACKQLNYPVPEYAVLRKFVGPPLVYSFRTFCNMEEGDVLKAVQLYREHYNAVGWKQNRLYDGVVPLLEALKREGAYMAVASGKMRTQAERIITYFDISRFFSGIAGVDSSASGADKVGLIRQVLPSGYNPARTVMIGDRKFDIEAARALGLDAIGVLYGYGSREELESAGATGIADSPEALRELLRQ